jgi:transmembrane sensor
MSEIKELLDKFSTGKISEEEEDRLFRLLDEQRDEFTFSLHHEYLHLLGKEHNFIKKDRSERILKKLHQQIQEAEGTGQEAKIISISSSGRNFVGFPFGFVKYFVAAASVVLLVAAGWLYVIGGLDKKQESIASTVSTNTLIRKINNGRTIMPVALPDGSSVWLHANSNISYRTPFDRDRREIYLNGRAFFEVSKNPNQPFVVISNSMITTVLGTSFTVDAFEGEQKFSVTVKTGNVIVTTAPGQTEKGTKAEAPVISLNANEVAIFDRVQKVFNVGSSLQSEVARIKPVQAPENYYFEDVAVVKIFEKLSKDYGVPIELDENVLSGCSLNTTLSDKPFFEKLKIICEGIGPGTTFSEKNGVVTISSLGCNK